MATVLSPDGYETGNTGMTAGTNGTPTVQSTIKRSGTYALLIDPVDAATEYVYYRSVGADGMLETDTNLNNIYARVYIYIPTGGAPASDSEEILVVNSTQRGAIRLNSDRTLSVHQADGAQVAKGTTVLAEQTWYRLEFYLGVGATPAYELRIDGASELSGTGAFVNTPTTRIYLGKHTNRNDQGYTVYFDDFLADGAAWPGPGQGLWLVPDANGAATGWTASAGDKYACVDDVPHNSDTDYLVSTTSEDAYTAAIQDAATAGVAGAIHCVVPGLFGKRSSASGLGIALRVVSGATTQDTNVKNRSTYAMLQRKIYDTDPNTSAAWAVAAISALEVGALKGADANSERVTGIGVYVDYLPAATISGTVLDANSDPVVGATVALSGTASDSTTTDASGDYEFTGLGAGTYALAVSHTGYYNTQSESGITLVAGVDQTAHDFVLTLTYGRFVGTVTSSHTAVGTTPLANITVDWDAGTDTQITNQNGAYTTGYLSAGDYALSATGDLYSEYTDTVTIVLGADTTTDIAMVRAARYANLTISDETPEQWGLVQIEFDAITAANIPHLPYDASPPTGVTAELGATVDVLVSDDSWDTSIVLPCCWYQPMTRQNYLYAGDGNDWLYPDGDPRWMARLAPPRVGTWAYKIRIVDADGTYTSAEIDTFACTAGTAKGPIKVSATDSRYFEHADGTLFWPVGGRQENHVTYDVDTEFAALEGNWNTVRRWWTEAEGPGLFGIGNSGSSILVWSGFTLSGDYARGYGFVSGTQAANGTCQLSNVPVKLNTAYRFSAWVKTVGLTGTVTQDVNGETGSPSYDSEAGADTDWTELVTEFTSDGSSYHVDLKLTMSGYSAGAAYHTDWSLREVNGDGTLGAEILRAPSANRHLYANQEAGYQADYIVGQAVEHDIYLRVVVSNLKDNLFGSMNTDGTYEARADNNVHAAEANHCGRWYQEAHWRYLIARYGWTSNIFTWEFCNEANPWTAASYDSGEAMAAYFAANDPNDHVCTTSFWDSLPDAECWSNASYASMGCADWHQYAGDVTGANNIYPLASIVNSTFENQIASGVGRSGSKGMHAVGALPQTSQSYTMHLTPIQAGHEYTISWYDKAVDLVFSGGTDNGWIRMAAYTTAGSWAKEGATAKNTLTLNQNVNAPGDGTHNWDWTARTMTFTADATATMVAIYPRLRADSGDAYWDDITLYDDTDGVNVPLLDVSFDDLGGGRYDWDSAALAYMPSYVVGHGDTRQIDKPVLRGEVGITADNLYGLSFKGLDAYSEHQLLIYDTDCVWYRKLLWAQLHPGAVFSQLWYRTILDANTGYDLAGAFLSFASDLPISNGRYVDIAATCSAGLRAFGQKDTQAGRAHIWIDNHAATWHAVADAAKDLATDAAWATGKTYAIGSTCTNGGHTYTATDAHTAGAVFDAAEIAAHWTDSGATAANPSAPAAVSGTVAIAGMPEGVYTIDWYNTATGAVTSSETQDVASGTITLTLTNLASDTAARIDYLTPRRTGVSRGFARPGQLTRGRNRSRYRS